MKRHLEKPTPQPVPVPTLSVEEEAILQDEQNEAEIVADAAAADADRITEVAEVAQDAVLVVDETPEVGQVEQELVGAVGDMAVAGTDANPEEIIAVPAAAEGEQLGVEGIASTLKAIWDGIVTAIKNMWVGLKHWLTTYFSSLEQNRKHADRLIERLKGMKGQLANDGAMLTSHMVDIFHYTGRSFIDLFNSAGRQDETFKTYVVDTIKHQHDAMVLVGAALEYGYQNFEKEFVPNSDNFVSKVTNKFKQYIHDLKLEADKGGEWATKQQMGQMKVVVKGFSDRIDEAGDSAETKISLLSKIRFSVEQDTSFGSAKIVSVKNDVTTEKLIEMVQSRIVFIDELLKFKNDQFKALEAQLEKVQKACSDMLGRVKEENKEAMALSKRMMPLTTAYANWATQPTAKLLSTAARHNKFWLSLFEMATNNFQEA
jgi:uncharacterized coiled-coil protein SlyX